MSVCRLRLTFIHYVYSSAPLSVDDDAAVADALTDLLDMVAVPERVTVFLPGRSHPSLDVAILSSILDLRRLEAGPLMVRYTNATNHLPRLLAGKPHRMHLQLVSLCSVFLTPTLEYV